MGFVGFLNLLVTSFDVLGWPVITIVYPIYASIEAIQTNSHFENRRWLTYWVLCGLIMIFELICARFIGWFPFWPQVKLITTCWLAIPHFNGAGYAYNHFVRPCFTVNLQTVKNLVRPGQEEFHISESDNFLLVAERYIQEKGSEALEKLIFDKVKCKGPNYSDEQNTFKEDMKNEEAETFKEDMKNEELAETFDRVNLMMPIPAHPDCKSVAIAEKKSLLGSELEDGSTAHCESSVQVNAQKEWTCALCLVCTSSEHVLQKHLQGKKHKTKEKEIENTLAIKNRFTSTSNSKGTEKPKQTSSPNSRKTSESKCRVTQNASVHGQAQKDKPVKEFVENSVCFTKKKEKSVGVAGSRDQSIQKSQSNADRVTQNAGLHGKAVKDKPVKEVVENSVGLAKKKENSVGVAGSKDHSIQKSQNNADRVTKPSTFWCKECKVKCSSLENLIDHYLGRKHLDHLIQKSQNNADRVTKPSTFWCKECKVKCSSLENLIDHYLGSKHLARLQEG